MVRNGFTALLVLVSLLLSNGVEAQTRSVPAQAIAFYQGPDVVGCGPTVPSPLSEVKASWENCIKEALLAIPQACNTEGLRPLLHITLRPVAGFPPILETADGPAALLVDELIDAGIWPGCGEILEPFFQTVPLAGSVLACPSNYAQNGFVCESPLTEEDPDKSKGKPCTEEGNPCNVANGNKFEIQQDYVGAGEYPLRLVRFHNSQRASTAQNSFGPAWTHSYSASINVSQGGDNLYVAQLARPDGQTLYFSASTLIGPWTTDGDISHALTKIEVAGVEKWRLTSSSNDVVEIYDVVTGRVEKISDRAGLSHSLAYDSNSRLQAVSDRFGRTLTFSYDTQGRVSAITDPASTQIAYTYDAQGNLESVTYPGSPSTTRTYRYEDPNLPHGLTGVVDENSVAFAAWEYDANKRAISSQHAGGAERVTFAFTSPSATDVTKYVDTSVSATRTYNFDISWGVKRLTSITGPACPTCGPASSSYDSNGNVSSQVDWNGNRANYVYDLVRNLQTSRTEGLTAAGATTPQTRAVTTAWHSTFRLPTQIAEPLRITTNVYDADGTQCGARGALCSRTIQATTDASGAQGLAATPTGTPRTWTYTYNANGSVLTVNGPRTDVSDVTTYTYYANDDPDVAKRGNVASITNAAGHRIDITAYNAHGQPLTIVDANALTTTLTYDARQRLKSRSVGSELTSYDYDNVGQLTKITLPDGSFLSYGYDPAHRLTSIQDNAGNRIAYTLDLAGNRTLEQVFDPASQLAQKRSRVYSSLNRLFQELGALNQTTEYSYDNQGNVTSVKDPLNHVNSIQYDALNRIKQMTDPGLGITTYAYNGRDALIQVTDPRNLVTGYTVDGLGNLTLQASPDTGNTIKTYDSAGNVLTRADAKGQVTTYAYDALNRVTLITFQDGSKEAYAYDQGTNGIGRLSTITETNASNQQTSLLQYAYTPQGRVASETRTLNGVTYVLGYSYDGFGRLSGLTYPSGRTLAYTLDSLGRTSAISSTFNGQTQQLVSNVTYQPFGGVKSYSLGNGQAYARSYDQDGRINNYTLGPKTFTVGYDAASRIEFISEVGNAPNINSYAYDSLDRLTSAVIPGTSYGYTYDAVGNRLSKSAGAATETLTYSTSSNRVATLTPASGPPRSFVFDANGSTTNDGVNGYGYDVRGRMVQATSSIGATSYQLNALGQRIRKSNSQTDTVFHYDTVGRLIAETSPTGSVKREIFYLNDIPVGVAQ
jgi:YD repeat-containing protein